MLRKLLPEKLAYSAIRWKNIQFQQFIYRQTRTAPEKVRNKLLRLARKELGPDCDFDTNFTPRYNPWDQRLCLVPNADFFHAVRDGKASVITDQIDSFTENGIRLKSGVELEADIIVTATGLDLCLLGGARFFVDGQPVDFSKTFSYKSMMFSDVPNLVSTFGYINASWTLKADLTAEFVCRLLNHMDDSGTRVCTPRLRAQDKDMPGLPWIADFSSNYIQRKIHLLPKQGDRTPWINTQNYCAGQEGYSGRSIRRWRVAVCQSRPAGSSPIPWRVTQLSCPAFASAFRGWQSFQGPPATVHDFRQFEPPSFVEK